MILCEKTLCAQLNFFNYLNNLKKIITLYYKDSVKKMLIASNAFFLLPYKPTLFPPII